MQVQNLAALGFLLAWGRLIISTPAKTIENKKAYNICETDACIRRANLIKESLNTSADPCTDFYTYACGGWMATHKIPESKSSTGGFYLLADQLKETLRDILGNVTLVEDNQNATDKAAVVYNACVAVPDLDDRQDVVLSIMNDSGLADWPKTSQEACVKDNTANATTMLAQLKISTILQADVSRDSKNLSGYVILLDQLSFQRFMKPHLCDDELEKLSNDLLAFEGKLANLTARPEERRNFIKLYRRTTIGELERNFTYLTMRLSKRSLWSTTRKLNEFLRCADPDTLYNYAGLRRMLDWASVGSKEYRNASFELQKVRYGLRKQKPRWEVCVQSLNDEMSDSVGYLYVQQKFSQEAKKEVQDMASRIMAAFNESLQNIKWMDGKTKAQAEAKLKKMGRKIAYPDWLFNKTYLEGLYEYVPKLSLEDSYGKMMYAVSLNKWIHEMKKLRRPYDRDAEWLEGAAVVNAFYNPSANEMGIFYEHGVPRSLNFGAIGMVVGHEMTHGFDDTGSQFDADGALKQWWSNKTREEFMNRTKCFEYQYGNITDKETNMTLNGKNTVGENIADNGGLRLSFEAFKNLLEGEYRNVDTRLKGMENVTGKQLFFLSTGMTWCSLSRPEYLKVLIQYDTHSPGRYRVNVPMSNMKAFSETFNCPANSTMNRTHRCSLWGGAGVNARSKCDHICGGSDVVRCCIPLCKQGEAMQVQSLAALGFLLLWGRLIFSTSTKNIQYKKPYNVCDTPVCVQRAKLINESLNTSADPCTDFYSYACGGWMAKHVIPKTKPSLGTFSVLRDELRETLRDILGNMSLVEENQNVTDKAALVYNACVAVPDLGDRRDVVLDIMNLSGLCDWPKIRPQGCVANDASNATAVLSKTKISTILAAGVGRDSRNLSAYVIQIDQLSFPRVGRNQLINQTSNSSKPIIAAYKKLIKVSMKFMKPRLCDDELEKLAHDLLAFEGKLANMTKPPEERRDIIKMYNRIPPGQIGEKLLPHTNSRIITERVFSSEHYVSSQ
ncbi:hypothetical protein MTO96_016473 [Rhipicephalus appendiculatus]